MTMNKFLSIFDRAAVFILIGSMVLLLLANIMATNRNHTTGKTNQTYLRATNCFAATSPTKRTPDYVVECYDKAEEATGIKVERYGDGQ